MPSRDAIVSFDDTPPPDGVSPYVDGATPDVTLVLQEHDEAWPATYELLAQRVRAALGFRVLALEHVGSTAVPGLLAKPIIDLDLIVADPDREDDYVPALRTAGFDLRVREPWWYRHRLLRSEEPLANLHVWDCDSPEPVRHRIFRDWLRLDEHDRSLYAAAKQAAVKAATALGEDVNRYNERKSETLRQVYAHAFAAAGLDGDPAQGRTPGTTSVSPVTDLDDMLGQMAPGLDAETYVFGTLQTLPDGLVPLMVFREDEGLTLLVTEQQARRHGVAVEHPVRRITLRVHSALDGVGLTAAVSGELAAAGISCNVVAAHHHDHLFVPEQHARTALQALEALSARHRPVLAPAQPASRRP